MYETLKELIQAIKNGEVDESKMTVSIDNDSTSIYLDDEKLFNGGGYDDILDLYELLFPKADVDWC